MMLNKYGFISGGYIFDWLDRLALNAINTAYPKTKDQQIYTANASIEYYKQLCNTDEVKYNIRMVDNPRDGEYFVIINLTYYTTTIASAEFYFKKAKHNYCETKEKNKRIIKE